MFVVTNRIKTKPGMAERMAPSFAKPGPLQEMKGFQKVEVLITQNLTEHDELNVNMYWDSLEDFTEWRNSDVFKEAHKGSGSSSNQDSPILGSEIVIAKVAASIGALS